MHKNSGGTVNSRRANQYLKKHAKIHKARGKPDVIKIFN